MSSLARFLFYNILVRFVVSIILGVNVRNRHRLPKAGPAIVVANHNSHLDTMVLTTLFPARLLHLIKPVAAMDYFLRSPLMSWFALRVIGIVPLKRKRDTPDENLLQPIYDALDERRILIFFPEGSRGEAEVMSDIKSGIARLAAKYPEIPIVPVVMHGLGKALPKGETLLVPFFCDVYVGEPIKWNGDHDAYMELVKERFKELDQEGQQAEWL
jgi:1-acyl-sn-glycerol-3-phosphate acyltransferase